MDCSSFQEIIYLEKIEFIFEMENKFRMSIDFIEACKDGNLEEVERIWNLGEIDLHEENDYIFILTCQYGNLPIAEWLWNKSVEIDSLIDIHAEHEEKHFVGHAGMAIFQLLNGFGNKHVNYIMN